MKALKTLAATFAVSLSGIAFAQPAEPDIAAIERSIPEQPWYPAGYRDLRIAAEIHWRSRVEPEPPPQPDTDMPDEAYEEYPEEEPDPDYVRRFDVISCWADSALPTAAEMMSPLDDDFVLLALDVADVRVRLQDEGYPAAMYEDDLLQSERQALKKLPIPDDAEEYGSGFDFTKFAAILEKKRRKLAPGKIEIMADGGCGAGEAGFNVRMVPASGRLWLISAFAFRVCERKARDPWTLTACRWTEYGSGDEVTASGRYVYQVRWPDGTVQRGTRELQGEDGSDEMATITFRKN